MKSPEERAAWLERLKARAEVTFSGCWLWQGCVNNWGYGKIKWKGKVVYVHRLAYWLVHGRMPKGGHVLHKCDTPGCFNPDHLQGGTQSTNLKHAWRRGRRKRAPVEIEE